MPERLAAHAALPAVPGPSLEAYFAALAAIPLLSAAETAALAAQIATGDADAARTLTVHHLRLAAYQARRLHPASVEAESGWALADTVQAANQGLWTAVWRYDPAQGAAFSTYAVWWIRQAVWRQLADFGDGAWQVPQYWAEAVLHFRRAWAQQQAAEDAEPSLASLATGLHWPLAKIEAVAAFVQRKRVWLDAPAPAFHDAPALREVVSDPTVSVWERIERHFLQDALWRALHRLPPRTAQIVMRRFGLDDDVEDTLAQIGQQFGVTRERIRQIERDGLHQLARDPDLRAFWEAG